MKIGVQNIDEVRKKISLFHGLTNDQVQTVVDVGNLIELDVGRVLCQGRCVDGLLYFVVRRF